MHLISVREGVEDFSIFCKTFDVRSVIAAVDERGNADGYVRKALEQKLIADLESDDPARRKLAAEVKLHRRLSS